MKTGQRVLAEDPSDLSSRLAQYNNQVDEVELVVEKLTFALEQGANTVTTEVMHDTNVLSGASASHYYEGNCGGEGTGGFNQEAQSIC